MLGWVITINNYIVIIIIIIRELASRADQRELKWFGHVERMDGPVGVEGGSNWRVGTRETGHFCLALCSSGPPSRVLVVITWRGVGCRYMIPLG